MRSTDFDKLFRRDPVSSVSPYPPAALAERLLDSMDVRVEAFAICRIARDAALVIPAISDLKIMYVLKGTMHLSVDGNEPLVSTVGSIVLLPKNLERSPKTCPVLSGTTASVISSAQPLCILVSLLPRCG